MNKAELIKAVSEKTGDTQVHASQVIEAAFAVIKQAVVDGDFVNVAGFGVFKVNARKSRVGHNPKTGEKIDIPARRVPAFQPSRNFKDAVSGSI